MKKSELRNMIREELAIINKNTIPIEPGRQNNVSPNTKHGVKLKEGVWADIMKGVRKSESGAPFSIVVIEYNKVVGQDINIKIQDAIPAHYEDMKCRYPRAKLHIEDRGGATVWMSK